MLLIIISFAFKLFEIEIFLRLANRPESYYNKTGKNPLENKKIYGLICCVERQLKRKNNATLAEYGVSPVQLHVMVTILMSEKQGKPICQRDIEHEVLLRPSSVSTLLSNLEKGGFLVRAVAEGNARSKNLLLTEKGKELCHMHKQLIDKCDEEVQQCLTEEEQDTLTHLLLKVLDGSKQP
jgi:DNA-binding MarR family transcriptional regulator